MEAAEVEVVEPIKASRVQKEIVEQEEKDTREWLEELGADASIKVALTRMRPKTYRGYHVGGTLETYDEPISNEDIREAHGGGKYQLKVSRQDSKGRWKYFAAKTIEIAGPPKLDNLVGQENEPQPRGSAVQEDSTLAERALQMTEEQLRRAQEEAERAREEGRRGPDVALLETFMAPLREQMAAAQRENADLRRALMEKMHEKPPENPFQERLLDKLIDGDNARITALRAQYESEIRTLKENHAAELAAQRRAHEQDVERLEKRHEREIETIKAAHAMSSSALETANGVRADALKMEVDRLNRELTEARAELATLRAKKDKPITEQASEILQIKEALESLGGGGDGDKSVWERLGTAALESPILGRLLGAAGGDDDAEEQNEAPAPAGSPTGNEMLPPVGVPFQAPDGNIYVRRPDDSLAQVDPDQLRKARAAAARRPANGETKPRAPDEVEVAAAVAFMEAAIRNGTSPEAFASSAGSMIPADILAYIKQVGVDEFLNKVAKLEQGSPLATQSGRNFARKVGKFLLEGTTG